MAYRESFDFISKPNEISGIMQLAATTASDSRGDALSSVYTLQGVKWSQTFIDAAQEEMYFNQVMRQEVMPLGNKDYVIKIRKAYLADSSWETSSAEYSAGTAITKTTIDTPNGIQFTPARENYAVSITIEDIQTNALDVSKFCMDELKYKYANTIDSAARDSLLGTVVASGGTSAITGTEMTNSVAGIQTIFGGDATDLSDSLDAEDKITTDLVAKAARLLESDRGVYWNSNVETVSAAPKNAWTSTEAEPFVLFIAPQQKEVFRKDPQFVNAAEYGSNRVVMTGEIGEYLGIRVVVTTKVPKFASTQKLIVQGAQMTFAVSGHVCALVKAKRCGAMVFRQKGEFSRYELPDEDKIAMKLSMAYQAKPLQDDAIVRIVVAD